MLQKERFTESITNCIKDNYRSKIYLRTKLVSMSAMKGFNQTVQILQENQKVFNDNTKKIEKAICTINDQVAYFTTNMSFLEICERFMENWKTILTTS